MSEMRMHSTCSTAFHDCSFVEHSSEQHYARIKLARSWLHEGACNLLWQPGFLEAFPLCHQSRNILALYEES